MNNTLPQVEKDNKKGCFFWGIVVVFVSFLILVVGGYFLLQSFFSGMLEQYTEESSANLPRVELSESEELSLLQSLEAFQKGEQKIIELTPEQISFLVNDSFENIIRETQPDAEVPPVSYIRIEGDEIEAELSIPLKYVPLPMVGKVDRYLNGKGNFTVSLENQKLDVRLRSLTVGGATPPEKIMRELLGKNLAEDSQQESEEFFSQVESIEVSDGKVVVRAR